MGAASVFFLPPTRPGKIFKGHKGGEGLDDVDVEEFTVCGGNMGMGGGRGGAAPVAKKKVKKKVTNYDGIDKAIRAAKNKKDEYQIQMEMIDAAEQALTDARKATASMKEPTPSVFMRFWDGMIWLAEGLLTDEERTARKPGHVRYSEVIIALMYWNKKRNIVPSKDQEERKEFDEIIITEVAFQLIHGCINGGIVRRRERRRKEIIRERFQKARDILGGKQKEKHNIVIRGALNARQKMIAQAQDAYVNPGNMERMAADPETGPILSIIIKIAVFRLATGSQLAQEAENCEFKMGKVGIFSLDESELETVLRSSHELRTWARHVDAVEHLNWFITEAVDCGSALVRLAARHARFPRLYCVSPPPAAAAAAAPPPPYVPPLSTQLCCCVRRAHIQHTAANIKWTFVATSTSWNQSHWNRCEVSVLKEKMSPQRGIESPVVMIGWKDFC